MGKRFQHNASAYGISGKFHWPVPLSIPVRPSVDLPPEGGYGKDEERDFCIHDFTGFRRAYTEVSGSPNHETRDGRVVPAHNNLSLAVVEDFHLLHCIEVEKMVSRITTRYFEDDEYVEIVLTGTRYQGFRIFGHDIFVKLGTAIFLENPTLPTLRASYERDEDGFRDRYHKLSGGSEAPEGPCPDVQMTLVEEIVVPDPTPEFKVYRNAIEIPHIGRLFLAELTVTKASKSLSLLRWELGCPVGGTGNIGGGEGGGAIP